MLLLDAAPARPAQRLLSDIFTLADISQALQAASHFIDCLKVAYATIPAEDDA